MLGDSARVSSSADFFSKSTISKNSFRNIIIRVANSLAPDQARRFVGPDLGPGCLQKLSADFTLMSEQRQAHKGLPGMPFHLL